MASRRASTVAIVVTSQAAGLVLLSVMLPVLPGAPSEEDLIWGGVAGLAGGTGVALLYHALAIGTMAVVAPTTAVCAVVVPVLVEAVRGERLGLLTTVGMALALVAIVLVSQGPHRASVRGGEAAGGSHGEPDNTRPTGIGLALLSGVAIGLFFLALARTSAAAGLWPLLSARVVSVALFLAVGWLGSHPLRMPRPVLTVAIACGIIDMLANALYILATRGASLSIVVTLSSLYPASTVLLARFVIDERLSRLQGAGVGCALVAVVLIVSGS